MCDADLLRALRAPGPDTFERFLLEWRADDLVGYEADELRQVPIPPRLRRFYELAGKVETVNLHLVPPRELSVIDGRVVFAIEEQGVFAFAVAADGDDPPVLGTGDARYGPWEEEGERLGRFLLQYALYEAVQLAEPGGWGHVAPEFRPRLDAVLPRLPLAPWKQAVCTFRARFGVVAILFEDSEVHAGARADVALEPLDEVVEWQDATHLVEQEHPREDDRDEELEESPTPDPEEKDPSRPDEDPEAD